jgi:hypothetical protein
VSAVRLYYCYGCLYMAWREDHFGLNPGTAHKGCGGRGGGGLLQSLLSGSSQTSRMYEARPTRTGMSWTMRPIWSLTCQVRRQSSADGGERSEVLRGTCVSVGKQAHCFDWPACIHVRRLNVVVTCAHQSFSALQALMLAISTLAPPRR